MFKRIDHVEIIPSSMERSIDFYVNVLGFRLRDRHEVDAPPLQEVAYLELGNTVVELLGIGSPARKSQEPWQIGYAAIALEVEDMDKAVEYLRSRGIDTTWGPVDLGHSIRAEIKDPDGLTVELREWR